jgi:hypothetical protein
VCRLGLRGKRYASSALTQHPPSHPSPAQPQCLEEEGEGGNNSTPTHLAQAAARRRETRQANHHRLPPRARASATVVVAVRSVLGVVILFLPLHNGAALWGCFERGALRARAGGGSFGRRGLGNGG